MALAKFATPGRLKVKIFQNKSHDAIILYSDVTSKTLSCDSNCVVNVFMWPNFGNSSISVTKVIMPSRL